MVIGTNEAGVAETIQESRLLKKVAGTLFGFLIAVLVTNSIQLGAGYVFPGEKAQWTFGLWGNHHVLRFIASTAGSAVGAFVAGCIAKVNGSFWGTMSIIPTGLFWAFVSVIGLSRMTAGQLIMTFELTIASVGFGLLFGTFGAKVRYSVPDLFEGRRNTVLGIKWYHWFWLFPMLNVNGAAITYSFYQTLWLLFGSRLSAALFHYLGGLAGILIFLSLTYVVFGTCKVFALLCTGYRKNLRNHQIALRVLGWMIGVWAISGMLQALTSVIFSKFYNRA